MSRWSRPRENERNGKSSVNRKHISRLTLNGPKHTFPTSQVFLFRKMKFLMIVQDLKVSHNWIQVYPTQYFVCDVVRTSLKALVRQIVA